MQPHWPNSEFLFNFLEATGETSELWEDRFKSLIVEDGVAGKTISASIDLNPVCAGMVSLALISPE